MESVKVSAEDLRIIRLAHICFKTWLVSLLPLRPEGIQMSIPDFHAAYTPKTKHHALSGWYLFQQG